MQDYLVSYDPSNNEYKYYCVIKGHEVSGNWPIYDHDPLGFMPEILERIKNQHEQVLKSMQPESIPQGAMNIDIEYQKKLSEGRWFKSTEELINYLATIEGYTPTLYSRPEDKKVFDQTVQ